MPTQSAFFIRVHSETASKPRIFVPQSIGTRVLELIRLACLTLPFHKIDCRVVVELLERFTTVKVVANL